MLGMDAFSFLNPKNNIPETESIMNNKQQGMTLVELMVTVAVLAILASVAAPSLKEMMENNRLVATNNQIISAINYTRSEAVKRALRVNMCASADGATCSTSGGFEIGWIIFTDCGSSSPNNAPNTTGAVCDYRNNTTNAPVPDGNPDSPEEILQDFRFNNPNITIIGNGSNPRLIAYRPNGNISGGGKTLTLNIGTKAKSQIILSTPTGRVRSCKVPEGQTEC